MKKIALFLASLLVGVPALSHAKNPIPVSSDKKIEGGPCEEAEGVGGSVNNCFASVIIGVFSLPPKTGFNSGSGVVISHDKKIGYVLTAAHVFSGKFSKIMIARKAIDGENVASLATLIAIDPELDLAILRVTDNFVTSVKMGSVQALRPGSRIYSIGSPGTQEYNALVVGNFIHRSGAKQFEKMGILFVSLPLAPGFSGGGVYDSGGRLIGINKGIFGAADGHTWTPLGYIISVDTVQGFLAKNSNCLIDSEAVCPDVPVDDVAEDPGIPKQ